VHEIRPPVPAPGRSAALDRAAAFAFALRLAVRATVGLAQDSPRRAILCCTTPESRLELGEVHGAGIAAAGLGPRRLILVSAAGNADALWAVEEGLKSHALALVIGCVDAIGLTPARRLSLAAAAHATPCLILQPSRSAAAAAVASRWQAGAAPSAPHPFDPAAPGRPAWNVRLERALGCGGDRMSTPLRMEWCDEALRFRVAAGLADRALRAHEPGRRFSLRAAGAG
jgi:protein ImuA